MGLQEAEQAIKAILKQLEIDTDSLVEGVSINDIEITTFGDDRKQLKRELIIELHRTPGNNW